MPAEDINLRKSDVQQLSNRQEIARFFLKLGYDVEPITQTTDALGITAESLRRNIEHIEQIAVQDDWLYVYLVEVKSVRVADRQALARTFRDKSGDYLFIITSDYDTLDFVLLERQRPEEQGTAFARKGVTVLPHVLTVNRREPTPIDLRVLRRFTYTEPDVFYQFDKLISAYVVAAWSETYFNNRALFSDYYLTERLRSTDAWQESPVRVYRELQRLFADVRDRIGRADTATTQAELVEPVFRALGWEWDASPAGDSHPDYVLRQPGTDEPLALCLAYPWNRHLDMQATDRDSDRPDDIPGQRVVSVLASGDAPYVILTNGKLWRLYAAQAHSRATNYYEIDLEETLSSPDREIAIRYFWLFFRMAAFVPEPVSRDGEGRSEASGQQRLSFIDRVLEGSENYAKELGERLKERVFEDIFPHFAEGFVEHIRRTEGKAAELGQERLDLIYQGTLTFLYRLMFLLYAEARDLLPVQEARGYAAISLKQLKEDVAAKGGNIEDEAPAKLRAAYSGTSTELYQRLNELFAVVDKGEASRNVPRYNGGLFDTQPEPGDDTPEGRTARFLQQAAIPDRYLALGLDRLARDVDDRTHALVMIDFKSLGVRQLGSIYEGLLEFKLRIAPEKMAIVKEKSTEKVVPYREAKEKKKAILTTGRGQNKTERTLAAGTVYLENSRQERKATGSYYTPDYIVKYIVEHTVGPVLAEKFDALRPRLRDAERAYYQNRKNAAAKDEKLGGKEDPEKFWNSPEMERLAYDVLDVKVLDPAMGSGHFLVQAVDFIADHLLDFLNGFPNNPVRASLSRTRQAILDAMDEQGVSVDAKRLTDVNLLKRQVLKRCVYGVDLNPMAVELAKVSLWLDAFTLGAPLSFLDHHLRCGNSLIGTTAREADAELAKMGTAPGQMTFLEGPFKGLLRSAEIMRGIGMLSDATMEQAQRSADLFESFEEAALPYKRLLDIYVMRDFGVKRADEFLRLHGVDAMTLDPGKVAKPYDEVLVRREEMFQQYRFFHWDLEFPEVFIDLDKTDWKKDPGFDAVVGNPPWVDVQETTPEVNKYQRRVYDAAKGKYDQYSLFLEQAVPLLSTRGRLCFITPSKFFVTDYGEALRGTLALKADLFEILDLGDAPVFQDAATYPVIMILGKLSEAPSDKVSVIQLPRDSRSSSLSPKQAFQYIVDGTAHREIEAYTMDAVHLRTSDIWHLRHPAETAMWARIDLISLPFKEHTFAINRSLTTGLNAAYVLAPQELNEIELEDAVLRPLVTASDLEPYTFSESAYIVFPYEQDENGEPEIIDLEKYPKLKTYFEQMSDELSSRRWFGKTVIEAGMSWYAFLYISRYTFTPKLMFPKIASRTVFSWDVDGSAILLEPAYIANLDTPLSPLFILACLNSQLLTAHVIGESTKLAGGFTELQVRYVERLPIRNIDFTTPAEQREGSLQTLKKFYVDYMTDRVLLAAQEHLDAGRPDVIHDLLAYLAQQMIDLNKEKQAEVSRFLGWLEGQIGAPIDDLSGKTFISGYLGDYQKGEDALPADELIDRLYRNKSKFGVPFTDGLEHRIRQAYQASLDELLPVKQRLADTDRLIDQIVYRLYGLTDEEIAIVEGRE